MIATKYRSLGFLLPTIVLVGTLHLAEDMSFGKALDGLLSGLWFVVPFILATAIQEMAGWTGGATTHPWRELFVGSGAAVLIWVLIWAFWRIPATDALRVYGFVVNSSAVFLGAWLLLPLIRLGRPRHV